MGSVRLALVQEAARIAELQTQAWGRAAQTDAVEAWQQAILRPPLASMRVLVAIDDDAASPVGVVVTGPNDDPDAAATDGLIAEWVVSPDAQGKGHTSRLLTAAVDTLRADGFTRASIWLRSTDDGLRELCVASGWGADGAYMEVGDDDQRIKLIRLATVITDSPAALDSAESASR